MDKEYLYNRIATADDTLLVVILYEGLMENLKACSENIDDLGRVAELVGKCRDILAELLATLQGDSDIAKNLRGLYLFINKHITEGYNRQEKENFFEAIKVLTPVYEAWCQIGDNNEMNQSNPAIVAGLTYGKNQLNTYVSELKEWKKG